MIGVFIDGANLYHTCKQLKVEIDYKRLREMFGDNLFRAYYYTAILPDAPSPIKPLLDWLEYNGFDIIKKDAKKYVDPLHGSIRIKGNMDIEMAVDVFEAAVFGLKEIWLFTGDGDFTYLVNKIKRLGVKVTIISTIKTSPPMIADELRRAADTFIDLADLAPKIKPDKDGVNRWG